MKTFITILPVIISALLIGAHFLRSMHYIVVISCMALPLVLIVRHPVSVRIVQAGLVLATIEWIRTTIVLASMRAEMGLPWMRLVIILGIVACFTFSSVFVFFTKTLKERYGLS